MAAQRWVVGCGIGCGAVLLAVIALSIAGGVWIKNTTRGFEDAVGLRERLEQRFGDRGDFTPGPDGAVPAGRMQVFLAIRDATAGPREEIADFFESLPTTEAQVAELESQRGMEKAHSIFGIVGSAFGFGRQMGVFFEARNRALIEHGMGLGEYTYIYVLAYRSWLGQEAGEGPEIDVDGQTTRVNVFDAGSEPGVRADLRRMLANQLAALPDATDAEWRRTLEREVAALEADRDRIPWQDSVPSAIVVSFEPYRESLRKTYRPAANMFELLRNRKRGRMSYTTD